MVSQIGSLQLMIYRLLPMPLYFALRLYCDLTGGRNVYLRRRLGLIEPSSPRDGIWLHVASVGEVSAIAPVALELLKRFPKANLLLTAMTKTGLQRARSTLDCAFCDLLPYDFLHGIRRYVRYVRASALIIGETEIWPNLVLEASRVRTKLALVNGRLSASSFKRYRLIKGMMGQLFDHFDCLLMRTELDAERIRMLGAPDEKVMVVGNTKYDMLPSPLPEEERSRIRHAMGIPSDRRVIALGSLRAGEIRKIMEALRQTIKELRPFIIIAPRHLNYLTEIEDALSSFGCSYSRVEANQSFEREHKEIDAILFTGMGKLIELYAISDIAIIGGTFEPYGGHNPLEPASQGAVTIAGPYIDNIREDMMHLQSYGGAFVADEGSLGQIVSSLLESKEDLKGAGRRAIEATWARRGASKRCVEIMIDKGVIRVE